jgi:PadR family transcriptional regulator PadR
MAGLARPVNENARQSATHRLAPCLTSSEGPVTLGIEPYSLTPKKMRGTERRDLFPGAIEMMVLQLLKHGPLHGYALAQQIKQRSENLLQVEEGSLYPALQRMLKEGWLEAEWRTSPTNRRVRVYKITTLGRKKLQRELSNFEQMMEGFSRVMRPVQT